MKNIFNKGVFILSYFWAISAGIILILAFSGQISQKSSLSLKALDENLLPLKVRVSNIYPRGFTVSWLTKKKTVGWVVLGEDRQSLIENKGSFLIKNDERGEESFYLHSVTIRNLKPETRYYFKISSGGITFYKPLTGDWSESGLPESVALPPESTHSLTSLPSSSNSPGSFSNETSAFDGCLQLPENKITSCFRPNPIYGQVVNTDATITKEALVYLQIPGKSNLLSAISDDEGKWTIDLANLLKSDLSGPMEYRPGLDLLKITALGSSSDENSVYQPIPPVIKTFQDKTNPVKISLLPLSTASPSPSPTATLTPTIVPTQTPVPPIGTLVLTIKLQDFGNLLSKKAVVSLYKNKSLFSSKTVVFTPQSDRTYQGSLPLFQRGDFTVFVKPENCLKKNLGIIKIISGESKLQSLDQDFSVGDLNNDNAINSLDLSFLVDQIVGKKGIKFDLNEDGKINTLDLSILAANYLKTGD